MAWMEVLAPAKLNLFLELIEQRGDGFHEIETVMTAISLFDRILLQRRSDDQTLLSRANFSSHSNREIISMPEDNTNLAWQAIDLLQSESGQRFGVDIVIQKNIPSQAGMGGGSSNAAAVLVGANRLFHLGLNHRQLMDLGNQLGSDVAFFVGGYGSDDRQQPMPSRTAKCLGRGELLHPVVDSGFHFLVAMPPEGLSTADVYRNSNVAAHQSNSESLVTGLGSGNVRKVAAEIFNRLQQAAEKLCPWAARLSREFRKSGCFAHQLTGSGSAWFGLFSDRLSVIRAANRMAARLPSCSVFAVRSVGNEANFIRYRAE